MTATVLPGIGTSDAASGSPIGGAAPAIFDEREDFFSRHDYLLTLSKGTGPAAEGAGTFCPSPRGRHHQG